MPKLDLYGDPLPPGAITRIGTTRLHPGGEIYWAAFFPDGTALITGNGYGFHIWDAKTHKLLETIAGREFRLGAALSPDGKLLAFAAAKSIVIYDIRARKDRLEVPCDREITFVAFSLADARSVI